MQVKNEDLGSGQTLVNASQNFIYWVYLDSTMWGPKIAKLVNITTLTMVYGSYKRNKMGF